jgi:hypothetical protein
LALELRHKTAPVTRSWRTKIPYSRGYLARPLPSVPAVSSLLDMQQYTDICTPIRAVQHVPSSRRHRQPVPPPHGPSSVGARSFQRGASSSHLDEKQALRPRLDCADINSISQRPHPQGRTIYPAQPSHTAPISFSSYTLKRRPRSVGKHSYLCPERRKLSTF